MAAEPSSSPRFFVLEDDYKGSHDAEFTCLGDSVDVFIARGMPGSLVVSERFASFVARHGFTHMKLIPTEGFTWEPLRRGRPPPASGGQA